MFDPNVLQIVELQIFHKYLEHISDIVFSKYLLNCRNQIFAILCFNNKCLTFIFVKHVSQHFKTFEKISTCVSKPLSYKYLGFKFFFCY